MSKCEMCEYWKREDGLGDCVCHEAAFGWNGYIAAHCIHDPHLEDRFEEKNNKKEKINDIKTNYR